MAIKESDIKGLFKTIMQDTMKTVSAGRKTVIAPTQVRNIAKEIISEAESGSVERFERALVKTEGIIEQLGFNISDFNKSLGKRIEELRTQRDTSAKEVEELREEYGEDREFLEIAWEEANQRCNEKMEEVNLTVFTPRSPSYHES